VSTPIIFSIGHSNTGAATFFDHLGAHGIGGLADVRAFPASRRHPHFGRAALAEACAGRGIAYRWMPGLGGRRTGLADSRHVAWRAAGFRAYADYMDTPEFAAALAELAAMAAAVPTAVMCAEALWWQCHRRLIADALVVAGWEVRHIVGEQRMVHELPAFARLDGGRLIYDRGVTGALPL
jgi:uncharacterized protein (DUF488 family)